MRISDDEQWTVPMFVTGAWEPSGNWTAIFLWTVEYEEKNERDVHIWLEAHESIIQQEDKQVRIVPAKWTDDPPYSSLDKSVRSLLYCSGVNWLVAEVDEGGLDFFTYLSGSMWQEYDHACYNVHKKDVDVFPMAEKLF